MEGIEIYFDGYCPESLLKGKQVEMRLNEDDLWESEATGLQMAVFPPYAAVLRWRGAGKFRQSSATASDVCIGLVMAQAQVEEGKEIFPDEENIISDPFDLEMYLEEIYDSKEAFNANKFNPSDPIFGLQEQYLNTLAKEDYAELFRLYKQLKKAGYNKGFTGTNTFNAFHEAVYQLKLPFNFKWQQWGEGWKNINNKDFDYTSCSLLQLSMYITAIFRADHFDEVSIKTNFRNGVLDRIFSSLKSRVQNH